MIIYNLNNIQYNLKGKILFLEIRDNFIKH